MTANPDIKPPDAYQEEEGKKVSGVSKLVKKVARKRVSKAAAKKSKVLDKSKKSTAAAQEDDTQGICAAHADALTSAHADAHADAPKIDSQETHAANADAQSHSSNEPATIAQTPPRSESAPIAESAEEFPTSAELSANAKSSSKPEFSAHIERIKYARETAGAEASQCADTPRAALSILWELVFDRLCEGGDFTIADFNTLAGVVQKLCASRTQMENSDAKNAPKEAREGGGISQETLEKIERQLKLL